MATKSFTFISQDFQIIINLSNIQHYVYNKNKIFIRQTLAMMENYDQSVKISHNPNWPYIPDHLYRILINSG